jgi:hypothetical protein
MISSFGQYFSVLVVTLAVWFYVLDRFIIRPASEAFEEF